LREGLECRCDEFSAFRDVLGGNDLHKPGFFSISKNAMMRTMHFCRPSRDRRRKRPTPLQLSEYRCILLFLLNGSPPTAFVSLRIPRNPPLMMRSAV
jgi:hypothetical protein